MSILLQNFHELGIIVNVIIVFSISSLNDAFSLALLTFHGIFSLHIESHGIISNLFLFFL